VAAPVGYQWSVDWDDDGTFTHVPDEDVVEWSLDWGTTITPTASSIALNPVSGSLVLQGRRYSGGEDADAPINFPHVAEVRTGGFLTKRCRIVPVQRVPLGHIPVPSVWRVEHVGQFALDHNATGAGTDEAFKMPAADSRTYNDVVEAVAAAGGPPLWKEQNDFAIFTDEIEWSSSWAGFVNWFAGGLGRFAGESADGRIQFWFPRPQEAYHRETPAHLGIPRFNDDVGVSAESTRVGNQTEMLRTRFYSAATDGTESWKVIGDEKRYGVRQARVPDIWPPDPAGRLQAVAALALRVIPRRCFEISLIETPASDRWRANWADPFFSRCGVDLPLLSGGRLQEDFDVLRTRLRRDRAGVVTRTVTGLGAAVGTPALLPVIQSPQVRILSTASDTVTAEVDLPAIRKQAAHNWYWAVFKNPSTGSRTRLGPSDTLRKRQFTIPVTDDPDRDGFTKQSTVPSASFTHPRGFPLLTGLEPDTDYSLEVSQYLNSPPVDGMYIHRAYFTTKTPIGLTLSVDRITKTSARATAILAADSTATAVWMRLGTSGTAVSYAVNDEGQAVASFTGLTEDTAYTVYAALSKADLDDSSKRALRSFRTLVAPKPVPPPPDVSAIALAVSGVTQTTATVTLTSSGPADTWYYRWYRFGVSPPSSSSTWTSKATSDSLALSLTSLTAGTAYVFEAADNAGFRDKTSAQWTTSPASRPTPPPPADDRAVSISITDIAQTSVKITLNSTGPAGTWYYRWYRVGVLPPTQSSTWSARNNKDSLVLSGTSALTAGTEYVIDVADNSGFRNKASQKWTTASTTPAPAATVLVSVRSITATGASFTLTSETVGSRWFWQLLRGGKVLQSGSLSIPPAKAVTKALTGLDPSAGHTLYVSRDSKFPSDDRKQVVFSTRTPNPQVTGVSQARSATWTLKGRWPGVTWTWWVTRQGTLQVVKTGSFTTTAAEGGLTKAITAVLEPSSTYVLTYSWAASVNIGAKTATLHTKAVSFSVSKSGTSLRVTATQDVGGRYYIRSRRMPATLWTDDGSVSIPPGGTASKSYGSRQPGVYEIQVSPRSDFGAAVKNTSIQVG